MTIGGKLQLKIESIRDLPFQTYETFTFIVNNERFATTRLIADLLSSKIRRIHHADPTLNEYILNTQNQGNFSSFLKLVNFDKNEISEKDIPFILEIITELGYDSFRITFSDDATKITNENVLSLLEEYIKYGLINQKKEKLINYIAAHFGEIIDEKNEEIIKIDPDLLEEILNNRKLKINDEDQLLHLINSLYSKNKKYSNLYCHVIFQNAGSKMIDEFFEIFDLNDINHRIWFSLSKFLKKNVPCTIKHHKNRYKKQIKEEKKQEIIKEQNNLIQRENNNEVGEGFWPTDDWSFPSSQIEIDNFSS